MAGKIPDLEATVRAGTGKGAARQARRDGLVPGVVYGGGSDPIAINIPFNYLLTRLRKGHFMSTLQNLKIEGHDDVRVICRNIERHVVKDLPTHIDLMRLKRTSRVKLQIPVEFLNEETSVGLKKGGVLTVVRNDVELEVLAGDIAAAIGLKSVTTGDTLCDENHKIILERMEFPEPVISVAVEPKSKADQEKMGVALGKLAQEDPSFRVRTDEESGQTIISGMGELHLDIIVDRMRREFKVEANIGKPQVAYRERIRKSVDVEGKFVRQSGGRGQYGHVKIKLEPLPLDDEDGENFIFVNEIVGGVVPKEYIPAVQQGIEEQMQNGCLAGYPLLRIKATLYDGSYHDVDSNEMAFKVAGSMAMKKGALEANPALLEPIMRVEVVTPEDYMGDVVGDLNRRRGVIQGMDEGPAGKVIRAEVPLSEMFGYATDLRSATQGRASYAMEFSGYSEAPSNIAEAIIKKG